MQSTTWIVALILLALVLPMNAGALDTAGCHIRTDPSAIPVGNFYVKGAASYWQETNEVPGLQIRESGCSDGRVIPADECVVLRESAPCVPPALR